MKTSELITSLVQDVATRPSMSRLHIIARLALGALVSFILFLMFLGVRPDFAEAITDPRVQFKFLIMGLVFLSLLPLLVKSFRPEVRLLQVFYWLIIPVAVLAIGVTVQIATCETGTCIDGLIGRYAFACLKNIPILAIGPLIALLAIMRYGATTEPVLGGAIAGASAGGVGGFIYAFHCPDDSALFVAVWYSAAISMITIAGALIGSRVLRW